jgi:localization factor PodJL
VDPSERVALSPDSTSEGAAGADETAGETILPPDHPLEPGTARQRRVDSPAERIAASQAALEEVKSTAGSESAGKADFIAAARRAAQAAGRQASSKSTNARASDIASAAGKLANRVGKLRALIAGTSAIVLVFGSLELARTLLIAVPEAENTAPVAQTQTEAAAPPRVAELTTTVPDVTKDAAALARTAAAAETATPGNSVASRPASMISLPLEIARQATSGQQAPAAGVIPEVTGTITPPVSMSAANPKPAVAASAPPFPAPLPQASDNLPAGLGAHLRAAALKGEAAAQYEVALRFAEGRGVPQNLSGAAEWFERAAKKGLAPAQFRLAGLFEKGLGVTKNLDTARRYYIAAGEAGHAKALHNLAVLYAEGIDGKPDYQTAAKWFRKAASYGVSDSQYNLAVLYARGIGVEANLAEAYKWFALAARDGDTESARKRDDLAGRLDQASLQMAMQAAQTFVPEQQPEAAVHVKTPAGGWDQTSASSTLPSKRKPAVVGPKLDLATPVPAQ